MEKCFEGENRMKFSREMPAAPFVTEKVIVRPEWIDENGHMNVAYYLMAFDHAIGEVFGDVGIQYDKVAETGVSTFAVENHITYQGEVFQGDRLRIESQLLGHDAKRWHWFQSMYHAEKNYLAATIEWLVLCIDLKVRKVREMLPLLAARTDEIAARHAMLPYPPEAGRVISLQNRRR